MTNMVRSYEPLTAADLLRYVEREDDFAFELKILKLLRSCGFRCQHSGSYIDALQGKAREFDIRATVHHGAMHAALAVECKQLHTSHPLLVLRTPRTAAEAVIDIRSVETVTYIHPNGTHNFGQKIDRKRGLQTPYVALEPVGRSFVQVWKNVEPARSGKAAPPKPEMPQEEVGGTSKDVFERMSQAFSSAEELARSSLGPHEGPLGKQQAYMTVRAILVVPDGSLWVCDYDQDGEMVRAPEQTDTCAYYAGMKYKIAAGGYTLDFAISHLDVMTVRGLATWAGENFSDEDAMKLLIQP